MSQPPIDPTPAQPEPVEPAQPEQVEPAQEPAAPEAPQFAPPTAPQPPTAQPYAPPASPQYAQPVPPQYAQPAEPQYAAPGYAAPGYAAPGYAAPGYAAPGYAAPGYAAPLQFPAAPLGTVPGPGGPFDGAVDPEDLSRPLYNASFSQAVKRFFKQYANFNGRASRSEYWWVVLLTCLIELIPMVLLIAGVITMIAGGNYDPYTDETTPNGFGILLLFLSYGLFVIIGLALLIPTIALSWRRLHDANLPGPLYFLSFVTGIIMVVFALMPPKAEGRRFDSMYR